MNKDINPYQKNIHNSSIFKDNKKAVYVYGKIERISSALYIISELFDESEPIRNSIRQEALNLLTKSTSVLNTISDSNYKKIIEDISMSLLTVVSLIRVSYISGLISEMNHDVLEKELEETLGLVSLMYEHKIEHPQEVMRSLSRSFFEVPFAENTQNQSLISKQKASKKTSFSGLANNEQNQSVEAQHTDSISEKTSPTEHTEALLVKSEETIVKTNSTHVIKKQNLESTVNAQIAPQITQPKTFFFKGQVKDIRSGKAFENPVINSFKNQDRNELIISMLKAQGPLTVKDFSLKITNCSEKTIQRLLNSLVSSGAIKRVGERRWSKYML